LEQVYEAMQLCLIDGNRDFRKCQAEIKALKVCMDAGKKRAAQGKGQKQQY